VKSFRFKKEKTTQLFNWFTLGKVSGCSSEGISWVSKKKPQKNTLPRPQSDHHLVVENHSHCLHCEMTSKKKTSPLHE